MLFRYACIGDHDIDRALLIKRGCEFFPRSCVTFDKGAVGEGNVRGRCEVENEGFGAFSDKDLDCCETDT